MGKLYVYTAVVAVVVTLASLAFAMVGIVASNPVLLRIGSLALLAGVLTMIGLFLAFKIPGENTD
jgi:hypothetical protein